MKNRKTIIIIAVLAIAAICAVLAIVLGGKGGDKAEETTTAAASETQTAQETTAEPSSGETTAKKVNVGKETEKALGGNTCVLLGLTIGTEGDYFQIAFNDGKAELTEEVMGKKTTAKSDYKVKDDGVYVTVDSALYKSIDFKFEATGKSSYITYTSTIKDAGADTDLAVIKADYDNESRLDIVQELDGKTVDAQYFKKPLNMPNGVKITFNKDAEYADDVLLATIDGFSVEYNINCKGINSSLLYCDLYIYGNEGSSDGEPRRYKFCIEKTDGGYQLIAVDGNGMHFETTTIE